MKMKMITNRTLIAIPLKLMLIGKKKLSTVFDY